MGGRAHYLAGKRWSSFDFLDPYADRGSIFFEDNWMHANSLWLNPRGNVILGSNFLSQIISISPDFGQLEWRLGGPNATIAPSAPMEPIIEYDCELMWKSGRQL